MLSKEEKRKYRSDLFRHLDGIAVAPTCYALHKKGVLAYILEKGSVTLTEVRDHFSANEGYINVALRILSSQGWLVQELDNGTDSIQYSVNDKSKEVFSLAHLYEEVDYLLKFSGQFSKRKFQVEPFLVLEKIMNHYKGAYDLKDVKDDSVAYQVLKHIEGIIVGPTVVSLGMSGMFHNYFMESSFSADEFHSDAQSFERLLDFFVWLGWFYKKGRNYSFTDKGFFFAKRASAYGVTVSYIPTFRNLDELLFGHAGILRETKDGEDENALFVLMPLRV